MSRAPLLIASQVGELDRAVAGSGGVPFTAGPVGKIWRITAKGRALAKQDYKPLPSTTELVVSVVDSDTKATTQITLSYTFHDLAARVQAGAAPVKAASKALDHTQTAR